MMLPPPHPAAITVQAAPAGADAVRITRDLVRISSEVARATFPGSRCDGKITLNLNVPEAQMFGGPENKTAAAGLAFPGTCRIDMSASAWPSTFCGVYVHEYGHHALTGTMDDHANPIAGGIMLPEGDDFHGDGTVTSYGPCERALSAYTRKLDEAADYRANAGYRKQERDAKRAERKARKLAKARARAKARAKARIRAAARRRAAR